MADYLEGLKREVAEIKFLIHDLRVDKFVNNIIHFHVTLNTDLEIYNVEQAQALHNEDLKELKEKAVLMRKALQSYHNAVHSYSPENTILSLGRKYIDLTHDICELILNPLWGRSDKVLSFLPREARSVQSRSHYRNSIRWICGVFFRIKHFYDELNNIDFRHVFDIGEEVYFFTRNVIYGYATEKSSSRVELIMENLQSAAVSGNLYRFRRMFFNLVMNSVDALTHKRVGIIKISTVCDTESGHVTLIVSDDGSGIPQEKIDRLLADRDTLDGEVHSLGFVFVRETVKSMKGTLEINSVVDKGTAISICIPLEKNEKPRARVLTRCEQYNVESEKDLPSLQVRQTDLQISEIRQLQERSSAVEEDKGIWASNQDIAEQTKPSAVRQVSVDTADKGSTEDKKDYGRIVYEDYKKSEAQFPGAIFAIAVKSAGEVEFFTHRPYEKYWNISHEDLSPMYYESTIRGRIEEDDAQQPELILKSPINRADYFEFKEVDVSPADVDRYIAMVHDEYILTARALIRTGLQGDILTHVTDLTKFFPDHDNLFSKDPFPLQELADQSLKSE